MSEQLTLFTEASHVSPLAWLETKKAKTTPVTCGRNFRAWSETLNRVGYSLKTYLVSCVSRLTMFVPIWSVKATMSGYSIMKLRLSVQNIDGKEYSLWRTPDAHCYRGASSKERYEMKLQKGLPISLNDQVGGSLNPEWVESLMGFPVGWTEI